MDKKIRTIFIKLILAGLVVIIPTLFSFVTTNFYPEYFTQGDYGIQKTQNNYAENNHANNRVLIIGDSLAQVSYMPSILSSDTYNYGIGGATPVDGYYRLLTYLRNHQEPKYIICSYNISEFLTQSSIWKTITNLLTLPYEMSKTIMQEAERFPPDSGLIRKDSYFQLFALYNGIHPDNIKSRFQALFFNIFQGSCYREYLNQCNWVKKHKGHYKHHISGGTGEDVMKFLRNERDTFCATEMGDYYMRKILDICRERGIQLIYETIPLNENTYKTLSTNYCESYKSYWKKISADYPDVIINSDISYYDNKYFGDCNHFNGKGTEKFSRYIKRKYPYVFENGMTVRERK